MLKLYCDPISTTSRPVMLFLAEHDLPVEIAHVDLMTEGHKAAQYLAINPNGVVPYLVDGDFGLGESSAILKYLADKVGSPTYPTGLQARARVNEALDWFNTQFHEYFCLFVCYPNMGVPHGMDPAVLQAIMAYGREQAPRWLKVLDAHMLAGRRYVCGDEISLADYLGVSYVLLGEVADYDFSPYPNVTAWLARMRERPAFEVTFAGFRGLLSYLRQARAA